MPTNSTQAPRAAVDGDTGDGARRVRVAVSGNPNAGKTTLFNGLTGGRAKVGNYPGVTVESRAGTWSPGGMGRTLDVVDVPGCYALTARSPEEALAIGVLLGTAGIGRAPDVVLNTVDATNLERNLYLTVQLMELGLPVVIVLTMTDLLRARGGDIDRAALSRALGVPVVEGRRGEQAAHAEILAAIELALAAPGRQEPNTVARPWTWPTPDIERELQGLAAELSSTGLTLGANPDGVAHWYLGQIGESLQTHAELPAVPSGSAGDALRTSFARITPLLAGGADPLATMIQRRHAWVHQATAGTASAGRDPRDSRTDRIDRFVAHPVFGPLLFVSVMGLVFQLMFTWSEPAVGWIEDLFGWLSARVASALGPGLLSDLVTEGILAGVGNVIVFLPQVMSLFFLLSLLDGSGYLARAAYIMDRLMARVGLHGKAFVPMLTSFACAVPGIAATRTIESPVDRVATMLIAPLMSCSARLPVYVLLISAFFPGERRVAGVFSVGGLVLFALYATGIVAALAVGAVLKRTILKSRRPPLVLELPAYQVPRARDVWNDVRESTWLFLRDAGTIILACTVLLWALLSFPRPLAIEETWDSRIAEVSENLQSLPESAPERAELLEHRSSLVASRNAELVRASFAGKLGSFVLPVFEPLGFDLRIVIGLVAAVSAREVMVSALGITYGLGDAVDETSTTLRAALREDPTMNGAVAVSLLLWFVFAFQCISTLAVMRRESAGWRWPAVLVAYQTALAWVAAFVGYRVALAAGLGGA